METREVHDKRRTVSFAASAEGTKVVFSENYKYYHFRNDGGGTVYVSAYPDVGEGVDGTKSIADGGCGYVFSCDDHVFVKGAAKITVEASNLPECPFKQAQRGGDITAKGNPVQIDGLQGGVPFSEMVVNGKNLMPRKSFESTEINGITFTLNNDGSITAVGNCTNNIFFDFTGKFTIPDGIYYLSGTPSEYLGSDCYLSIRSGTPPIGQKTNFDELDGSMSVISHNDAYCIIRIYAGVSFGNGAVFRPQLELGSTATEYEPPITGRDLTVNACGKNLLKYPYVNTTKTINGITFTDNGDGTVTANGTATANATFLIDKNFGFEKEGNYFLSGCPSGGGLNSFYINWYQNHTGVTIKNYNDYGSGIIIPYQHIFSENNSLAIAIIAGTTVNNLVFRPQLELGSTATEYEPYHGSTTTITPDSNPYTVPNDIRQLDGLNNISVSEGEISVVGVRKNAAIKRIWDEIDEIKTAIIVSNGESE